nr:conserved hypothetical protein, radical SAM superfamily [uncultured archaeon]
MNTNFIKDSKECEILINTTHICNLKCRYCFVDDGLRNFEGNSPMLKMDKETQNAFLSFIESYCKSFGQVTLHFYGGEPFLHFDAMKYIAEKAKASNALAAKIHFAVTTNGTLIDKKTAEFLDSLRFSVLVSCDGPPETHDKMRLTKTGEPTSQKVLKTIHTLKSYKGIKLGLSAVIHRENRLATTYRFLKSFSPDFIKAEYIRMRSGHPMDLDEEDKRKYFEDLKFIANEVISQLLKGKPPTDYRFNSRVLQMWRGGIKRKEFCGAGSSVLGIAANGDIFPCTLLIGEKDCYLGNVRTGISPNAVREFKNWHSFTGKKPCKECWARYYCGGGCAAMWKTKGRGFCEYIKNEIDLSFYIYNSVTEVNPEAFALMVSKEFYEKLTTIINNFPVPTHEETI